MFDKNKEFFTHDMPWKAEYGYLVNFGDNKDSVLADRMENQMKQTYDNIGKLLAGFDISPDKVVEEVIFVTDMTSAF
jgi:2-iminobutanoate/2-iminopropanoate deaminase